jgi:beta-lactamase regulating signal transducer with metallopeptidase domain
MTASAALLNLGSYSLQVAVLVGVGALLDRVLRLRAPGPRLALRQAILAGCLALPLCQPWRAAAPVGAPPPGSSSASAALDDVAPSGAGPARRATAWPTAETVLLLIGAGVVVRVVWVGFGLLALRRLRRTSSPLPSERPPLRRALERVGVRAEFRRSERAWGPITFGLRRPVVLLPPTVLDMAPPAQEAIATHELLHVRRRDWMLSVLEEWLRAVFWFHPPVGWLIGRIQLAREQVVDQAVIGLTRSREEYVAALLAVAGARLRPAPAAAPLFFRRGLLKERVAAIFSEAKMTTRRLVSCLAVGLGVLLVAAGAVVRLFPLEAAAQAGREEPKVSPPPRAKGASADEDQARLIEELKKALEDAGASPEQKALWQARLERELARIAARKAERAAAAERELKKMHEEADARQVKREWERLHAAMEAKIEAQRAEQVRAVERQIRALEKALAASEAGQALDAELQRKVEEARARAEAVRSGFRAEGPLGGKLVAVRSERLSPAAWKALAARLDVEDGDVIDDATAERIRATVAEVDERLRVLFHTDAKGGVTLVIVGR